MHLSPTRFIIILTCSLGLYMFHTLYSFPQSSSSRPRQQGGRNQSWEDQRVQIVALLMDHHLLPCSLSWKQITSLLRGGQGRGTGAEMMPFALSWFCLFCVHFSFSSSLHSVCPAPAKRAGDLPSSILTRLYCRYHISTLTQLAGEAEKLRVSTLILPPLVSPAQLTVL